MALVTTKEMPEPDLDEALLCEAMRAAGLEPRLLAWDENASVQALRGIGLCVIRSTWNYYRRLADFRVWLASAAAATELHNPLAVLEWNLHKRYLLELEECGVPTVPSVFLPRGSQPSVSEILGREDWSEVVIKPAVSAASFRTERFGADSLADAQAFLDELLDERDAMIQRYLPTVETLGERCLVQIDGQWSHVVQKQPRFADGFEQVSAGRAPTSAELELGERVMGASAQLRAPLLYARVDMFPDEDGRLLLSELELIEPSLFFARAPEALGPFVAAISARLEARSQNSATS